MTAGPDPARPGRQRGAGTVLVLAILMVAAMLAVTIAALGRVASARGTAQAAADLAAIAAATAASSGSRPPCQVARQVVQLNGAQLTRCVALDGGDIAVAAAVPVLVWGREWIASATARAGPVR
ncbi:MAG: Rv3654c family TadE-like protein [Beutenbergiaceae bacterium]